MEIMKCFLISIRAMLISGLLVFVNIAEAFLDEVNAFSERQVSTMLGSWAKLQHNSMLFAVNRCHKRQEKKEIILLFQWLSV